MRIYFSETLTNMNGFQVVIIENELVSNRTLDWNLKET